MVRVSAQTKVTVTPVRIQSGKHTSQEGNFPYVDGQTGKDLLVVEESSMAMGGPLRLAADHGRVLSRVITNPPL